MSQNEKTNMNKREVKWTHTKMTQKQTSDLARKKTKIIAFEMGPTVILLINA